MLVMVRLSCEDDSYNAAGQQSNGFQNYCRRKSVRPKDTSDREARAGM